MAAELSDAEKRLADAVGQSLRQAGRAFADEDYQRAGEALEAAMAGVAEAARVGSPALKEALEPALARISRAHTLLEFERVALPPLRRWDHLAGGRQRSSVPAPSPPQSEPAPEPAPDSTPGPAPAPGPAPEPGPEPGRPPQPSGGQSAVSFARDVAPVLIRTCNGCHLDSMNARGGLQFDTFAGLMRGGDSGPAVEPGQGDTSLLIEKLRGTAGQRMPAGGRPPLSDETIRLIAAWIDQGAQLDGSSESQPIKVMSQLAWIQSATPEAIDQRREQSVRQNLALALPGRTWNSKRTENFLVIGPVAPATIELVATVAESQSATAAALTADEEPPLFGGRATIAVLPSRYEYSEFARMVEQRSLPADWQSHWQFDGIDAYIAITVSDNDPADAIAGRLSSPVVSLAVATVGDVPRWLADGVGDVWPANRDRRRDRQLEQRIQLETNAALAAMTDSNQFLDGRLTPSQARRIGAAITATLLDRSRRGAFGKMLSSLKTGTSFEEAFAEAYAMTPASYIDRWREVWRDSQ